MIWAHILVIILAIFLIFFLLLAIILVVMLIRVTRQIKRVTSAAERTLEHVESAAAGFGKVGGPVMLAKLITSIVKRYAKKQRSKRGKS